MADITMCTGEGCPLAKTCYRKLAKATPRLQAYFVDPPFDKNGKCEYYWRTDAKEGVCTFCKTRRNKRYLQVSLFCGDDQDEWMCRSVKQCEQTMQKKGL